MTLTDPAPPAASPRLAALALALLALAGTLLAVALELRIPAGFDGGEIAGDRGWGSGLNGLVLGAYGAVVLLRAGQRRRLGWVLGSFGLLWVADGIAESYVRLAIAQDQNLPGTTFAAWFLLRFTALLPATIAVLVLLFPTGRFLPGRWGVAGVASIQMPQLDGIEATRFITARHPGVQVVMLTMNEDDDTVLSAIRAGASGYLLKGSGAAEVHNAIRAAAAGGVVFGAALAGRVASFFASAQGAPARAPEPFPGLSERERSVLRMLAAGKSNDAMAAELYVSNKTVRNTVSAIYAKLHASGRAEAIVKAREAGYG